MAREKDSKSRHFEVKCNSGLPSAVSRLVARDFLDHTPPSSQGWRTANIRNSLPNLLLDLVLQPARMLFRLTIIALGVLAIVGLAQLRGDPDRGPKLFVACPIMGPC